MRLFAIPDIHGRNDLLQSLLKKLREEELLDLNGDDKIIFTGDYVDRGVDSKGVLDTVRSLVEAHPNNVIALAGNHEWLMVDGVVSPDFDRFELWMYNGGDATLRSFPGGKVPEEYVKWVASLPLSYQEGGFFFSHAPVPKEEHRGSKAGKEYTKAELTWTYEESDLAVGHHKDGLIQVCGHIHKLQRGILSPRFYDHCYFLDSGCGCSKKGVLVAVEVITKKVIYARPQD